MSSARAAKKPKAPKPRSEAEELLARALEAVALPGWDLVREYRFHPERQWRFDFAFPSVRLAVEVDGRYHRTHEGVRNDCEKLNEAIRLGWRVLRFPSFQKQLAPEWAATIVEVLVSGCLPSTSLDSAA